MKTLILTILLLLMALPVFAYTLYQTPEKDWIFITSKYDYFATWVNQDLLAMWIERETMISTCLVIRAGKEKDCTIEEFSILMTKFPFELMEDLKLTN